MLETNEILLAEDEEVEDDDMGDDADEEMEDDDMGDDDGGDDMGDDADDENM